MFDADRFTDGDEAQMSMYVRFALIPGAIRVYNSRITEKNFTVRPVWNRPSRRCVLSTIGEESTYEAWEVSLEALYHLFFWSDQDITNAEGLRALRDRSR